jgi:DNA uptake protein ComE-like DNA-binding protein
MRKIVFVLLAALPLAAPALAQSASEGGAAGHLPLPSTRVPAATEGSSTTGTTSLGNMSGRSVANIVDINSATLQELNSLPDVGDRVAEAIIRNRPYKSPDELVTRGILPKNEFDEINDRLVAR